MEIEAYVDLYFGNPTTKKQYYSYLKLFYEFLGMTSKEYWKQERDHKSDVLKYWQECLQKDSPNTIPQRMSVIRGYFEENNVIFIPRFWRNLNRRGLGYENVLEDKIPTIAELQNILTHTRDAKEKAFFLMMLSSGLRENELIQLKTKDIDFDSNPVTISVPALNAKTKKKKFSFISIEAKEALLEWLKVKDDYLAGLKRRSAGLYKYLEDTHGKKVAILKEDYVFPFKSCTVRTWWNRCLAKAHYDKLDEATEMRVMHLYTLRKFFSTKLKKKCNNLMVEMWMGHKVKYDYEKWTIKEHQEEYLKGMEDLLVYRTPANTEELEKLKEEAGQVKRLQSQIESLQRQMELISNELEDTSSIANGLQKERLSPNRKKISKHK